MDRARGVDRGQAGGGLPGDLPDQSLRNLTEILDQLPERPARDVLHDQKVILVAVQDGRIGVEGPNDVLVTDAPSDVGLAEEALEEAGPGEEVRMEDLDGDRIGGWSVLRLRGVHRAHAPRAEAATDPEFPEALPLHASQSNPVGRRHLGMK